MNRRAGACVMLFSLGRPAVDRSPEKTSYFACDWPFENQMEDTRPRVDSKSLCWRFRSSLGSFKKATTAATTRTTQ